MRDIAVEEVEDVARAVIAIGNEYAKGHFIAEHSHKRAQLLYTASGVVTVHAGEGSWVIPPRRAVWIPPGVRHSARMSGPVSMRSVYVTARAARLARLPMTCQVVGVSDLLRALLLEAVDLPLYYPTRERAGRIMALILDEILLMPVLPLKMPLPADPRLGRICRALMSAPESPVRIDDVSRQMAMSRSTFTRTFRLETGMGFAQWLQQVRLLAALVRLANGEPVSNVAADLGYSSPSAFSAMFRKAFGLAPSQYFG
jgi:AraC-like DNA-binding protein/mannose-6-phosphate isomerase-like protein (cupin superfamily)